MTFTSDITFLRPLNTLYIRGMNANKNIGKETCKLNSSKSKCFPAAASENLVYLVFLMISISVRQSFNIRISLKDLLKGP